MMNLEEVNKMAGKDARNKMKVPFQPLRRIGEKLQEIEHLQSRVFPFIGVGGFVSSFIV